MYNTVSCYMLILPLPPEDFYLNPSLSNSLLNRYLMRLSMLLALRLNYVIQVSGLPIMVSFFFKLERGEGREREKNINVWLSLTWPLLGTYLACNPGMCPDWK